MYFLPPEQPCKTGGDVIPTAPAASAPLLPGPSSPPCVFPRKLVGVFGLPRVLHAPPWTQHSSKEALAATVEGLRGLGAELPRLEADLANHHAHKYPEDGTKTGTVALAVEEGRRLTTLHGAGFTVRVLVMAAADGDLTQRLLRAWATAHAVKPLARLEVHQSDLIPHAGTGIHGIGEDNWPLDATGAKVGEFHVSISRNCWYSAETSLNELRCGAAGPVCVDGLLLLGATRQMLAVVAPALFAGENAGAFRIEHVSDAKLHAGSLNPDAFVVAARKLVQGAPAVAEGSKLLQEIFVGPLKPTAVVTAATSHWELAELAKVGKLLALCDAVVTAVEMAQQREQLQLARGEHGGVSARFSVAVGLRAAAEFLLRHSSHFGEIVGSLLPLSQATGANLTMCLLLISMREGVVETVVALAEARTAAFAAAGGDEGRTFAACSINANGLPVLAEGTERQPLGVPGVYFIPSGGVPDNRKVGLATNCAVTRAAESAGGSGAIVVAVLPDEFCGAGSGGRNDAVFNYVATFIAQGGAEVPLTLLLGPGGLTTKRQIWGSPPTVYGAGDMGRAAGVLRSEAAAFVAEMRASEGGAEVVKEKLASAGAVRAGFREIAAQAVAGGGGEGGARRATTRAFRKLAAEKQRFMRVSDCADGGDATHAAGLALGALRGRPGVDDHAVARGA